MFHPFKGGCAFLENPNIYSLSFFGGSFLELSQATSIQYPRIPVVRDPGALTLAAMLKN